MRDELSTRRDRRRDDATAWFMCEWDQLAEDDRAAIADLVIDLHERGLRRRSAAVAWLGEHR